jgi:hypothetical protein
MWRITQTTDNQHLGVTFQSVEKGQVLTFEDGDVVPINQIYTAEDGLSILACGVNYQITLVKE